MSRFANNLKAPPINSSSISLLNSPIAYREHHISAFEAGRKSRQDNISELNHNLPTHEIRIVKSALMSNPRELRKIAAAPPTKHSTNSAL
ncbi:hypothetical protein [Saccharopolyspora gloriosae]|uniref:hypothetical protein n=1 Tax=Saccharopolyspora gloriosae TaxID=455344 RepID=UPI001FB7AD3C|nr:hypothetical protein [Saccharopolyspora gloriosae]